MVRMSDDETQSDEGMPDVSPSDVEAEASLETKDTHIGDSEPDIFRRIAYRRRTARNYDENRDIPDDVLADILATAQRAPTSFNVQPYKIVVVKDKQRRKALSTAFIAGNVKRVETAPVTIIFFADLEPARLIPRTLDLARKDGLPDEFLRQLPLGVLGFTAPGRFGTPTPLNLAISAVSPLTALPVFSDVETWSVKNTMFVASQMMLAASSHGVSSSPMEGFDTRRIFQELNLPITEWPRYAVPLAISLGYDTDSESGKKPNLRLPPEEVFFKDQFGTKYTGISLM
jgi:nitroreductase